MAEQTLTIVAIVVLAMVNALGVVLTALQLPGPWVMVLATAMVAWWQWGPPAERLIGWWALGAILALAVLGEIIEFLGGALGAGKVGGSKRSAGLSILGAIIGAIAGSFLIPLLIVGTLLGAAIGAGAGALIGQRWSGGGWRESLWVGKGAAIGRTLGAVGKLVVAAVMWVVALVATLW